MIATLLRRSLPAKLLVAVIVSAVIPLAAVGAWLTSTATRSGELLLESQLDSTVSRAAEAARTNWQFRRSDILQLAANAPVRVGMRRGFPGDTAPSYVRRAYQLMPNVAGIVAKDRSGRRRWTLGQTFTGRPLAAGAASAGEEARSPILTITAPIRDDSTGAVLGEIEAYVRLDALVSAISNADTGVTNFLAIHDRAGGTWVEPGLLPPSLLVGSHFNWSDHRWLAVRRSLPEPPIDIVAVAQLDPFLTPFTRTATIGAIALALAAFVVVLLTILVTARLTRSLAKLAAAADRVAGGDLDTRIDVASEDEVGRVASTFNSMTASIRRMMRELSQREAVAAMSELAATLAHQVRSPATAMRLDLQRAYDKLPSTSPERPLLARSLGQLDRLERAVSGSLTLARSVGADFRRIDVREPIERTIAGCEGEIRSRNLRLERLGSWDTPLIVDGDEPSLEQLFGNILSNAIHASPDRGSLRVAAKANGGETVSITIHDSGDGMPSDVLARAGEPFFSMKPGGTGLGLSIAKRIAAAHRGSLTIDSAPGAGTAVRVELPGTIPAQD